MLADVQPCQSRATSSRSVATHNPLSGLFLPSRSFNTQIWEAHQGPTRDSVSGAAFLDAEVHRVEGRPGNGSPAADLPRLQLSSLPLRALPPQSWCKGASQAISWV